MNRFGLSFAVEFVLTLQPGRQKQTPVKNNVDADETAHNEPSHQDLLCCHSVLLFICICVFFVCLFFTETPQSMGMSKFKERRVQLRNSGVKGLNMVFTKCTDPA